MTAHGQSPFTYLYCSVCGRVMGKKPGVQVVLGLVCPDPICIYQDYINPNQQRDSYVVCAALEGVAISQIAFATGITRQRVYQILNTWKQGAQ